MQHPDQHGDVNAVDDAVQQHGAHTCWGLLSAILGRDLDKQLERLLLRSALTAGTDAPRVTLLGAPRQVGIGDNEP
jgi:hypothetical protein